MFGFLSSVPVFFAGIFSGLVDTLTSYFTKKVASKLAVVIALAIIWTTFVSALNVSVQALELMMVPGILSFGFSLLPDNTGVCIGIVFTTVTAQFVFNQAKIVMMVKNPY